MKIQRLSIKNYRGIATLDTTVGPFGAIISGETGSGKTSILVAIAAALAGEGCKPEDIRLDASRAEILIDFDSVMRVRRTITRGGTSEVEVREDGALRKAPQTFLNELLGRAAVDPVTLFLAKPAERRALILSALPIKVTVEQLRQWAPVPADESTKGHGLEVVARVAERYYALRKDANAKAKASRSAADLAAADALERMKGLPGKAPTLEEAVAAAQAADRERVALETRAAEAVRAAAAQGAARQRIDGLRAGARKAALDAEAFAPSAGSVELAARALADLKRGVDAATEKVDQLRRALHAAEVEAAAARDASLQAQERVNELAASAEKSRGSVARSKDLDAQADALAQTLAAALLAPVAPEALEAAKAKLLAAQDVRALAERAAHAAQVKAQADRLAAAALADEAEASKLDGYVKALQNDAPRALMAAAKGIPGLAIDGDAVTLDGKRLEALCGGEKMRFAVDVAKRLNAKVKILVVDGLERVNPARIEEFVRMCCADDWQLLATRVDDGELVVEQIEPEDLGS